MQQYVCEYEVVPEEWCCWEEDDGEILSPGPNRLLLSVKDGQGRRAQIMLKLPYALPWYSGSNPGYPYYSGEIDLWPLFSPVLEAVGGTSDFNPSFNKILAALKKLGWQEAVGKSSLDVWYAHDSEPDELCLHIGQTVVFLEDTKGRRAELTLSWNGNFWLMYSGEWALWSGFGVFCKAIGGSTKRPPSHEAVIGALQKLGYRQGDHEGIQSSKSYLEFWCVPVVIEVFDHPLSFEESDDSWPSVEEESPF